jgi:phosphoribosylformylglycinamidine synthase
MVHRIEIVSRQGFANPKGENALRDAAALHLSATPSRIEHSDVYLIEGSLDSASVGRIAHELLADPVTQEARIGLEPPRGDSYIEVQPLPGVMDPSAEAIEQAILATLGVRMQVQTGQRYDMFGVDQAAAQEIARRALANTVIHAIHDAPFAPDALPRGAAHPFAPREITLSTLDDAALSRLSRDAHLFLSVEEMRAIQAHYRELGREPRDIELETLAQTWSEHCVHKTLKSTIRYRESGNSQSPRIEIRGHSRESVVNRPGHSVNADGSITIDNLLKSTIAAATRELMEDPRDPIDWCLSVFVDNSGVIAFDDDWAVCFKVETHNHPSAIEPYGGAATGIGGCIRDIMGTGLGAKPIAATDVFCVAFPETSPVPAGCLYPRRILTQVVAGVRDYGNRMGIPTLNGGVWFDDRYIGNPLVYCGVVGVMPRDRIKGAAKHGDRIVAMGGRTGRDGIHGATFSSAELTDTHADEFAHAVQIGNAVTEKVVLDAVLEARDVEGGPLFHAITDCGAGGFSSAVGEMGSKQGATVQLERAPLKYEGLTPTEIWISEAQERMILAVPPHNMAALQKICDEYGAEMSDIGSFGTDGGDLILTYGGREIGRLSMEFLHDGLPRTTREAVWDIQEAQSTSRHSSIPISAGTNRQLSIEESLLALLSHPNIASKHWIIRQYDHEVQGATAVKPLVGPRGAGPSDAAVILPVAGSKRGLAIANGLATGLSADPYIMALAAIDECVRNLVCVGADPSRIAILDNFCWPSCNDPSNLGLLVRAAEGCYDGAKAYRTPFISGKDSLNNQLTTEDGRTIAIPPTLLISGMGVVPDVAQCVTMDAKRAGNVLVILGETTGAMAGSHYSLLDDQASLDRSLPVVDLERGPRLARAVHDLIRAGVVRAAHDCSEGGLLTAAAEMAFSGGLGLRLDLRGLPVDDDALDIVARCFSETPSRYLLEMEAHHLGVLRRICSDLPHAVIGWFEQSERLRIMDDGHEMLNVENSALVRAWRGALDW